MTARLVKLPVANVIIGDRHRTDLGDLGDLVASIAKIGLIHEIVLTEKHQLISGHRRLEAWRQLHGNREPIPAKVTDSFDTAQQLLIAERDENTCRKDFAPSEAVAMGRTLEAIEQPKAKDRQRDHGGTAPGRNHLAQLAPSVGVTDLKDPRNGRVTSVVAPAVGMSARTYEKAKAVVAAANDTEATPEVRAAAKEAVTEMDRSGKVDPSYKKVKAATKTGIIRAAPKARRWSNTTKSSNVVRRIITNLLPVAETVASLTIDDYTATPKEMEDLDLIIKALQKFRRSLQEK